MTNVPSLLDSRLIEVGQRNLQAAAAAQKNAVERLGKIYEEGLRFMSERFDDNRKTLQDIANCRSIPDTMPIVSAYVERTAKVYSAGFETFASLVSEQTRATIEETVAEAQAAMDATAPALDAYVEDVVDSTKAAAAEAVEAVVEATEAAADAVVEASEAAVSAASEKVEAATNDA